MIEDWKLSKGKQFVCGARGVAGHDNPNVKTCRGVIEFRGDEMTPLSCPNCGQTHWVASSLELNMN